MVLVLRQQMGVYALSQSFLERAYWGIRRRIRALFGIEERLKRKWAKMAEDEELRLQRLKESNSPESDRAQ
ncbi:hypothetical protein [Mesorhizobium sp. WSM2239]|uniref:Uncharacterized protein n=2 Tax=unclassified Mesorhizobium TaxID=325217 RepID=A0AAU8D413_9HYPH